MKKRTKIILIVLAGVLVTVFTFLKAKRVTPLSWNPAEVNQPMFSDQAINGYDVVAYFTQKKAVPGEEAYTHEWKDARWYFSSEENRNLFAENPEKYAPKYGGYCAFAVSKGFTANSDPNTFELLESGLYLFADEGVKQDWKASQEENIRLCDANWN